MAKRAVKKKEIEEDYSFKYRHDDEDDGMLYIAPYHDSLFGTRLELRTDGRKRGLWIWLEEAYNTRIEHDGHRFREGLVRFKEWLDSPTGYKKEPEMLAFMLRDICFRLFFDHRTEGQAVRLTWKQVKQLEAKLTSGYANEKHKTEEDY